ncbi:MAG: DsbA family protein [Methanomicrobiales archaeon]|nr:DsbA family protein [Methanomicrobiales archaeon]
MKKDDKRAKEKESSPPKINLWMVTTAVLGIAFLIVLAMFLQSGSSSTPSATVSADTCGGWMIAYINENFVEPGSQATFNSAAVRNGMYEINTTYLGNTVSVYATQDCSLLFLTYPVDVQNTTPVPTTSPTLVPTTVKTAVPLVDLYVMSFCPYGVQAEGTLKPVIDLLGTKANFTVRYIASVNGNDINSVSSLHGLNEAKEDSRQLCIMEKYPEKYWNYMMQFNTRCYPLGASNGTTIDTCWKEVANGLDINASMIETCAYGSEGIALLRASETKMDQYGVTGSPTLIINGQKYTGTRSADAFKNAICNAFETMPAECSMNLTSNVTPATGSC